MIFRVGIRMSPDLIHVRKQLGARRIEFIGAAVIGVVFAVCFAHLDMTLSRIQPYNSQTVMERP